MAKIYVASSWRNAYQPQVVEALRKAGHDVYDFRNPPSRKGFAWSDIDQNWLNWSTEEYRKALGHPLAEEGFNGDFNAMQEADVCVLVLPCGRSANAEAGWMKGAGKKVYVLQKQKEEPELMYKMFDGVFSDEKELIKELVYIEDTKIRKEMLVFFKNFSKNGTWKHIQDVEKWIAWLEKQGNTNEIVNKKKIAPDILRGAAMNLITWIDYNVAEGNMCLSNMECKRIEDALVNGDWGKIYAYMKKKLEKQGEQKLIQGALEEQGLEFKDDKIVEVEKPFHIENGKYYTCIKDCSLNKEYHKGGVYKAVVNRIGKISLTSDGDYVFPMKNEPVFNEYFRLATDEEIEEISGNQGKISPNEPKFKKGEWVVYDGWTTQITEVYEDGYANDRQGFIPKVREDSMRKWTINDAKDGDVLASNLEGISPFIAVYKYRGLDYFTSYCFIGLDGKFYKGDTGHDIRGIHPATKEQRDTLERTMTNAGYSWDGDKKRLRSCIFDKKSDQVLT